MCEVCYVYAVNHVQLSVEAKAWLSEPCEPLRGSGSGMAPLPASVISPAEEREAALLALCQLIRHQPALFSEVNLPAWLDVFLNAFAADEYPNVSRLKVSIAYKLLHALVC